jgi:hypothetical protein
MNIVTFAKPGEENVISPDFQRRIVVDGVRIKIELESACWVGENRLSIWARGGKRINAGMYKSRRSFKQATMMDLEQLIKRVKLAPCSINPCKGLYVVGDYMARYNPMHVCEHHRLSAIYASAAKMEAKEKAEADRYDAKQKEKGFRYKAIVWIHHNNRSDTSRRLYFVRKPTREQLTKECIGRSLETISDYTITRL